MSKSILKSPQTYDEQVELIKSKGFIVEDKEVCKHFLRRANYYRLSAYFLPFLNSQTKTYFPNIPFTKIVKIYDFDQKLRGLIFGAIEEIEFFLRTQLAYYHSHTHGATGYLHKENFRAIHNHPKFIKHLQNCIDENKNSLVVKHHIHKYDNKFPLWVIIEFFSMGMLSYFFRDMSTYDQKHIARNIFNTQPKYLLSWLRCLTDLRNRCAHHSRLYFWLFSAIPKIPPDIAYIATRRLFAQLIMLKYLYPDKEKWNIQFLSPLKQLLDDYIDYISLKHIGFPAQWEDYLKA